MAKINEWLEKDKLILIEGWARDGLTEDQIAKNMGISPKTLYNWKTSELLILQALKKGKEVVDFEVENALLKRALGYTITIEEDRLDKDGCIHTLKKDVHIPADTTAQIFWLKNRKPDKWRSKIEIEKNDMSKVDDLLKEIKDSTTYE